MTIKHLFDAAIALVFTLIALVVMSALDPPPF